MTLVRWQPFKDFTNLQREMNQLFDTLDNREDNFLSTAFVPAAEIDIDTHNIYLNLEVPGLKPEEIEIQVNHRYVYVTGERKEEKTSEDKGIKRSEFRYGKFQRTIALPHKVQQEGVEAKYEHGVLKLTLPKAEDEKNKTVKVPIAA
jgi:HSP20 family protein